MYTNTSDTKETVIISNNVASILSNSWSNRVAVKTSNLDINDYYDINIPDYPDELVPFRDDPLYQNIDIETKQKILAGAWIAYNEKTISIELSIVSPACELLLKGAFKGLNSSIFKRIIAQTQVDEQFHILMCLDACLVTRKMHNIETLQFPQPIVIKELNKTLDNTKLRHNREIIQLAYSTVAETSINAYLNLLADNKNIQPFNRETTALHRKDESSHQKIFKEITKNIYTQFTKQEKSIFIHGLALGLKAFVKIDLTMWKEILYFLKIKNAIDIIYNQTSTENSKPILRDYSGFKSLLSEIDVHEVDIDFDFDH